MILRSCETPTTPRSPVKTSLPEVYLARHGETAWSLSGQHTGRTDLPLTPRGEDNARKLKRRLSGISFTQVLVSPLTRARRTCELAGFAARATVIPDLVEWDCGDYEGMLTADIHRNRPDWYIFRNGCPGGESLPELSASADRVITRLRKDAGHILIFGHGPFSRILGARWMNLHGHDAQHLLVSTASLSILGYEHNTNDPAIVLWNDDHHIHLQVQA